MPTQDSSGSTAGGTVVLRRLNRAAVLDALRRVAPDALRITELTQRTGLARPTVSLVVADLVQEELVTQLAPGGNGAMGRPATRVALNGGAAQVLGLDIGPHSVAAEIDDLTGRQLALVRRTVRSPHADALLGAVDQAARQALATAELGFDQIASVAAGAPGVLDLATGRSKLVPSVEGWERIDLLGHLQQSFTCPVQIDNDANLAALAIGHTRGNDETLIAIQWGDRLGAGIVVEHRLLRGHAAAAGEIGYIAGDGRADAAGQNGLGPLERRIGTAAIGRHAWDLARAHPDGQLAAHLAGGDDPAAATFQAAAAGDPDASRLVEEIARTFARAIAPIVLALDPDIVVIGGGIARAGEGLRRAIERELTPLVLFPPAVAISALAENAVVTGAIQIALEEAWHRQLGTTRG
ncbi:MAG: ROK family transcriptional regulator [Candidatus Dormibacteraceae bacterium]